MSARVTLERWPGLDGETRVGITCAICHSTVERGVLTAGAARRTFDYGRLRLAYYAATGDAIDPEQARRMATWGPGRADVTEDNDEDPVAIPDLWGLRAQRWLTQAATIRHDSPLALAIRQETQLIDSNRVPPLVAVSAGAPYLHDGSVASLDELLSAARLEAGYAGGRLGPGPIVGHRAGTDLSAADRAALIAFLATL